MKIKTLIIDDEMGARKAMKAIVEEYPEFDVIGEADSVDTAYQKIMELKPDLIFLDIQMHDQTGFDLLAKNFDTSFEVVFATAYDQYAIEAFKSQALSYLLKPISFDEFEVIKNRIVEIVHSKKNSQNSIGSIKTVLNGRISIPHGSSIEYINPCDIMYIEADASYCHIRMINGEIKTISKPLKFVADRIHSENFVRIHRSFFINLEQIIKWDKADGGSLVMSNNDRLPLSREGKKLLRNITL